MKVLGYNGGMEGYMTLAGTGHDASAALVVDGVVVAACEEERFNREKHSSKFPLLAMQYCLEQAGLKSFEELDLITYYWSYPLMYRDEMLEQNKKGMSLLDKVGTWTVLKTLKAFNDVAGYGDGRTLDIFARNTGYRPPDEKLVGVPHHLCHAASCFFESPFEESLIVTIDGSGESSSSLVALGKGESIDVIDEVLIPNSLGFLYMWMTAYLGFEPNSDEYKVMGLAPYGDRKRYRSFFDEVVRVDENGRYEVDPSLSLKLIATMTKDGSLLYPPKFNKGLGPKRKDGEPIEQRHMDIAAGLQDVLERVVVGHLAKLQQKTGQKKLTMAGGVALNCTMNGKIAAEGLFDDIYIHTAAHDAGTSLGGALFGYHSLLGQKRDRTLPRSAYLGPAHDTATVDAALKEYDDKILHERIEGQALFDRVAQLIDDGKVVGWYQGRMEWGPRALGNRSILADPRRDDMKDIVNHAVKLREGFRPFAPSALAEKAGEWFDLKGLPNGSPYMLFIVPVQDDKRGKIPAVTHVDGSARVQTVTREANPRYHALISAFEKRTGVPLVLNTSFNIKGEPIVNTPGDAIRCFLGTGIDALVVHDVVIFKRPEVIEEHKKKNDRAQWESGRVKDGRIESV